MSKEINVTRFSFAGGRAKPMKQRLEITGVNHYDERQIVFSVWREGAEKSSHVMALNLEDVKDFAELFKAAVAEAKIVPDTTPAEARKKLDAKKAKAAETTPAPTDVNAILSALQAAGYTITPPQPPQPATALSTPPTETKKSVVKRGSTHTKPAEVEKPVPALDDLDEIATPELEAVQSILSILLSKRGTK